MGCRASTTQQPEIQQPEIQMEIPISKEEKELHQSLYDEFYQACLDGNQDKIKIMIIGRPKINTYDHHEHKDALAHCYQQGHFEIIRSLISDNILSTNIYVNNLMVLSARLNHQDIWLQLFELKKFPPDTLKRFPPDNGFNDWEYYKLVKDMLTEAVMNHNIDMIDLIQIKCIQLLKLPNYLFRDLLVTYIEKNDEKDLNIRVLKKLVDLLRCIEHRTITCP